MDQTVVDFYSSYGKYINQFRAFPSIADGCKIVEKRLLYCLHEKSKDSFVKSAEVVGFCIGSFHPHGDTSTYGSLVNLVNRGLAKGQGNFGSKTGITEEPPAAQRYTEVRSSKVIEDMAFQYINYIEKQALEIKPEPLFLPTKLPLCLLGSELTQGIGFGSKTVIPTYRIKDLILRLKWLLTKEGEEPIIRPITDCDYVSKDEDFKKLLETGKHKIVYKGKIELDRVNNSVIVKSIPPNKNFVSMLKSMSKHIETDKSIGFIDESTYVTSVRFKALKRNMNITKLRKIIEDQIESSVSFQCNVCGLDGKIQLISVDDYLLSVYNRYKDINKLVIEDSIKKLEEKINEFGLIEKIKIVLPDWLKKYPDDIDSLLKGIENDTGIKCDVIDSLFEKYNLKRILKIKTDINALQTNLTIHKNNLQNLETYVWNDKYKKHID